MRSRTANKPHKKSMKRRRNQNHATIALKVRNDQPADTRMNMCRGTTISLRTDTRRNTGRGTTSSLRANPRKNTGHGTKNSLQANPRKNIGHGTTSGQPAGHVTTTGRLASHVTTSDQPAGPEGRTSPDKNLRPKHLRREKMMSPPSEKTTRNT